DEGVMNPDGLKGADEFVRHKLLDAIGDLSLLGAPLAGRVTLYKTGHGIHAKFMRELMKNKDDVLELTATPQAEAGSAGPGELRL
ncbi:MAG: UDP-3-O-[3-hydroxymyristoyl] N-acetylglucosamine deacetylase, partial [Proteobacteria bacterium]|nr:UDP-3-O-[3-hydroxymyristoyl] N-acetylglucosamine deacetylase [Pseudomonadota bacterium]